MPRRFATTWNGRSALRNCGSASMGPPTKRDARRNASACGATKAPTTSMRSRRRARTYTRHTSIEATLSAKWMPRTGQTWRTSDQMQICAACSGTPSATRRGAHFTAASALPVRKAMKSTEARK
jgi:hypothetical protein